MTTTITSESILVSSRSSVTTELLPTPSLSSKLLAVKAISEKRTNRLKLVSVMPPSPSSAVTVTISLTLTLSVVSKLQLQVPSPLSMTAPKFVVNDNVSSPASRYVPLLIAVSPFTILSAVLSDVMTGATLLTIKSKEVVLTAPSLSVAVMVTI